MIVNAEFSEVEKASTAISLLRKKGIEPGQIEIFSSKPVELKVGILDRPSRMSLGAILSALLMGTAVTAFIFYTQKDYPLVTGGMPLTSGWATGVVTFEFTMAGAILGTMCMFLWESGLLRKKRHAAPELPESGLVVQVACQIDVDLVETTLRNCGCQRLETLEELE